MKNMPFYAEGLRFSCTRCSSCCRYDPGFVFLSKKDADLLAAALEMRYTDFVETYCRWVPAGGGMERLSLREKSDNDCIFWRDGCSVYAARPLQCEIFPFWRSILVSSESWEWAAEACPGIGKGETYTMDHIESCLARQRAEPVMVRKAQDQKGI